MLVQVFCVTFVLLPAAVISAEIDVSCITPNGETGTCTLSSSCKPIHDAAATDNENAIEFAERSKCDNPNEDLVCCGSEGNFYQGSLLLPNRNECGIKKAQDRIEGGELTNIGEFPWMVLLWYKNSDGNDAEFNCGGTLINKRYVLTAAHCVDSSLDSVRLGEWNISTEEDCFDDLGNDCADPVVDIQIDEKIRHHRYNETTDENDIALLRLEMDVEYTDYIQPICLPHPNSAVPLSESEFVIAGWGATNDSTRSDVQLKLTVPIVSNDRCALTTGGKITKYQVCAGGVLNKDSCSGDSGGPLMGMYKKTKNTDDQLYQEGIISWSLGTRGISGVPSVHTRVAMYMDWIIPNLKK